MPRKCCIPECKSNYDSTRKPKEKTVSTFTFPKNEDLRRAWIRAVPRNDWTPTKNSAVCAVHFSPSQIVYEESVKDSKGNVFTTVFRAPKLVDDAVPHIFPNLPKYLSKPISCSRTDPEERRAYGSAHAHSLTEVSSQLLESGRAMSDECREMKEPAIKVELPDDDAGSLDAASTVKTEPADVDDVYSLEEETIVKVEIELEPTVIQPPDFVYKQQPCKQEPVQDQPAGPSCSVKSYNDHDKSHLTLRDKVDVRTTSAVDSQRRNLKSHIKAHKGIQYDCELCNKSFKQRISLTEHMRIHTGERPFNCKICNKSFTQRSGLTVHMKTHTGERPFNCELCNKSFTQRVNLITHIMIHTGERPFNCKVCDKSFTQRSGLTEHMKTHTEERPFNCEVCSKWFKQRRGLKEHMKIHTGKQPFTCEVCNKNFTQRGSLKVHMEIHTGERPLINCEVCNKCFTKRSDLIRHKTIHADERPYKCEICKKSFRLNIILKRHMKTHC